MRHFRLIFKRDTTILERRTTNGAYHIQELHPEQFDYDAQLLDLLLGDLSESWTTSKSAFDLED